MRQAVTQRWPANISTWSLRGLWPILGALLLSLLALVLAFQLPARFALDLGGRLTQTSSGDVEAPSYDAPYLLNFNDSEPARRQIDSTTTRTFRWSRASSRIVVPALGPGPWQLKLLANSGRPDGSSAEVRITAGDHSLDVGVPAAWRELRLVLPGDQEILEIELASTTYTNPGDPRSLGIVIDQLSIEQQGWRPWLPLGMLALLGAILLLLAVTALLAGVPLEPTAAGILALGAAGAVAAAQWRTALTIFAPALLATAVAALLLMLILRAAGSLITRRTILSDGEIRPIAGLIALGFLIRLGGLVHPQQISSDALLHAHNLEDMLSIGQVIFTEGLPCEAGAGRAPYPPAFYILLAPFLLLTGNSSLLVEAGAALGDALVIGVVWWIVWWGSGSQRAALLGAALYLAPPPTLLSLGVGELANVGGQALALIVLGLALPLVSGATARRGSSLLALLLSVGFFAHLGVAASFGLLLGCWSLLLIVTGQRRSGLRLLLATAGAASLALLLYYGAFIGDPTLANTTLPDCPPNLTLGEKLNNLLGMVFKADSITPPVILLIGLAGAALTQQYAPRLGLLLMAWWGATLISLATILFSAQTVRWQHFLYPALAIAGGLLLALPWGRGRGWRIAAAALLAYALIYGLVSWGSHIAVYLH